jgi:O-antigen/teichoic acid export membrane protein
MASELATSRNSRIHVGYSAAITVVVIAAVVVFLPDLALAQEDDPTERIRTVLANIRNWIVGIAAILVVVMLTIAGVRYLLANDPGESERAKVALKAAAIGFAIILLAPILVAILQQILAG